MRLIDLPGWSVTPLIAHGRAGQEQMEATIVRLTAEAAVNAPFTIEPGGEEILVAINVHVEAEAILEVLDREGNRLIRHLSPGFLAIAESPAQITFRAPRGFDAILLTIPANVLDTFSAGESLLPIAGFDCEKPHHDQAIHHLARAILPAAARGRMPDPAFSSWFIRSLLARLIELHGRPRAQAVRFAGGLNPANRRRVEEKLKSPHGLLVSASDLAHECRLSPGHFARAFRQTFGVSVYRCLLEKRIGLAKDLLQSSPHPLSLIASRTGFADQATFTESFSRIVGTSPGRYRRQTVAGR